MKKLAESKQKVAWRCGVQGLLILAILGRPIWLFSRILTMAIEGIGKVEGTVISCNVYDKRAVGNDKPLENCIALSYSYTVKGVKYVNSRFSLLRLNNCFSNPLVDVSSLVKPYTAGEPVVVYYSRSCPSYSWVSFYFDVLGAFIIFLFFAWMSFFLWLPFVPIVFPKFKECMDRINARYRADL